jgi:hypothetical protein
MDAKLKEQTHDIQRNEMEIRTNTLRLEKGMEAEANDRQRLSERLSEQAAQMATDKEAARVSTAGVMGRLADCAAQLQECVAHRQLIVALRGDVDDNTKTCDENTKSCEVRHRGPALWAPYGLCKLWRPERRLGMRISAGDGGRGERGEDDDATRSHGGHLGAGAPQGEVVLKIIHCFFLLSPLHSADD